jgi:hypothetical protein
MNQVRYGVNFSPHQIINIIIRESPTEKDKGQF